MVVRRMQQQAREVAQGAGAPGRQQRGARASAPSRVQQGNSGGQVCRRIGQVRMRRDGRDSATFRPGTPPCRSSGPRRGWRPRTGLQTSIKRINAPQPSAPQWKRRAGEREIAARPAPVRAGSENGWCVDIMLRASSSCQHSQPIDRRLDALAEQGDAPVHGLTFRPGGMAKSGGWIWGLDWDYGSRGHSNLDIDLLQ